MLEKDYSPHHFLALEVTLSPRLLLLLLALCRSLYVRTNAVISKRRLVPVPCSLHIKRLCLISIATHTFTNISQIIVLCSL